MTSRPVAAWLGRAREHRPDFCLRRVPRARRRPGRTRSCRPLCTTARPLHTRFAKVFGASISEVTLRPNPTTPRCPCLSSTTATSGWSATASSITLAGDTVILHCRWLSLTVIPSKDPGICVLILPLRSLSAKMSLNGRLLARAQATPRSSSARRRRSR